MSADVYQEVTDRIIAALEAGTVPWRRPWVASAETHRNPVSGTEYRGINPFLLELTSSSAGYGYYSTAFHELAHSTGHQSRLARPEITRGGEHGFGSESYAREELTAELAAAMLCGTCALTVADRMDQSAAYVANWLKALRNDSKMVIAAAGRGQRAADFIRGIRRDA